MSIIGKIAQIIDETKIVINIGSAAGVKTGQEFVIYQEGDEIFDPETKESLGKLELIKGSIIIDHVQEKLSIGATKVIEKKEEKKTLSEMMVDASVQTDKERQKLNIDRIDTHPQSKIFPVKIGDWVRSLD